MQHFIWVLTDCQSTHLEIITCSIQRVKNIAEDQTAHLYSLISTAAAYSISTILAMSEFSEFELVSIVAAQAAPENPKRKVCSCHGSSLTFKFCNLHTVTVLEFRTLFLFLFSNKMLIFSAGLANSKDHDQTAPSDLGLSCLSWPFGQATSVQKF